MKNKLILLLLLPIILFANLLEDFEAKDYNKICTYQNYLLYKNHPKALSLIGFSCVKTDNLFLLPEISYYLRLSKIGRRNGIYFLTLVLEKRLIYSYFFDNDKSIYYFDFPKTDYFLSEIFYDIKHNKIKKAQNLYIIQQKNMTYQIYKKGTFLVIDEIKNDKLIKRHLFR